MLLKGTIVLPPGQWYYMLVTALPQIIITLYMSNITFHDYCILICRFVNGEDYMSAVADALESARDEIYITGWA